MKHCGRKELLGGLDDRKNGIKFSALPHVLADSVDKKRILERGKGLRLGDGLGTRTIGLTGEHLTHRRQA